MRHVRNIVLVLAFFAILIFLPYILYLIIGEVFLFGLNVFEKYVDYSQWPLVVLIVVLCAYGAVFDILTYPFPEPSENASKKKRKASRNYHVSSKEKAQKNRSGNKNKV